MPITDESARIATGTGNGAIGQTFNGTFKIFATTDLKVTVEDDSSATVYNQKTLGVDYTVVFDEDADTFTVTTLVAFTSGKKVVIYSDVPQTQGTTLPREGKTPAKTLQKMSDRLTTLAIDLREQVARCLRFAVAPVNPVVPTVEAMTHRRALIARDNGDGTWSIVPSDNDPDELVNLAGLLAQTYQEGLLANRPAAPAERAVYYATDEDMAFYYIPTAGRWFTFLG